MENYFLVKYLIKINKEIKMLKIMKRLLVIEDILKIRKDFL